jgi:hypothetical protein
VKSVRLCAKVRQCGKSIRKPIGDAFELLCKGDPEWSDWVGDGAQRSTTIQAIADVIDASEMPLREDAQFLLLSTLDTYGRRALPRSLLALQSCYRTLPHQVNADAFATTDGQAVKGEHLPIPLSSDVPLHLRNHAETTSSGDAAGERAC